MFGQKRDAPKVYGFGAFFGHNLPPVNAKYCPKPKFCRKLHPQGYKITQVPGFI